MIRSFSIRYVWHVLEPCQKATPVLRKNQHVIDIHQGMNLRPKWGKTVEWITRHFFCALVCMRVLYFFFGSTTIALHCSTWTGAMYALWAHAPGGCWNGYDPVTCDQSISLSGYLSYMYILSNGPELRDPFVGVVRRIDKKILPILTPKRVLDCEGHET